MRRKTTLSVFSALSCVLAAAVLCGTQPALGAALWQGNVSNNFNDPLNWVVDDAQGTNMSPSKANCFFYLDNPAHLTDIDVTEDIGVYSVRMNWTGSTNPVTISSANDSLLRLMRANGLGIETLSGMGELTINSRLEVYATGNQTWSISSPVTINGVVSSQMNGARLYDVIKDGTAALTLNGINTFGDSIGNTFNLWKGTLNLGNPYVLGNYEFGLLGTEAGVAMFDNTSGAAMTLANNPQMWGYTGRLHSTFIGTNDLNLGTGLVRLNPGFTLDVNASTLTVDGDVVNYPSRTGSLTKTGSGTLLLNGDNTYSGDTTVNDGVLTITNSTLVDVNDAGVIRGFLGTGTLNLDCVVKLDIGNVTDVTGSWMLVDVANLNETYGSGFAMAMAADDSPFTNEGGGVWSFDGGPRIWSFSQLTGMLEVSPGTLTPGDASGDGFVDSADAAILAEHWLMSENATWGDGDFNDDKKVDDIDATIMAANWNPAPSASVPEPGAIALLLAGALSLVFLRRK